MNLERGLTRAESLRNRLYGELLVAKGGIVFDLDRLLILFKRVGSLPPLPRAVSQLIAAIDRGTASALDLERIIASDPILVAEILRTVGSSSFRLAYSEISSLRQAIIILGHRNIRALAVGISMRSVATLGSKARTFDPGTFIRHAATVATIARYLYARTSGSRESQSAQSWSSDEVYAAGLLHDIGFALLAHVDPDTFDRVSAVASCLKISMDECFQKCFGSPMGLLGAAACDSWGLPAIFALSQQHMHDPISEPRHMRALACLTLANSLSSMIEGDDAKENYGPPIVRDIVAISEEEINCLLGLVGEQVEALLENVPEVPRRSFQPASSASSRIVPARIEGGFKGLGHLV